jgi:hypothetical protein
MSMQILPHVPTAAERFAQAFGGGLERGFERETENRQKLNLEVGKQEQKMKLLQSILGGEFLGGSPQEKISAELQGEEQPSSALSRRNLTDEQILAASTINPQIANIAQQQKNFAEKQTRESKKETLPIRKEFADKAKYARQGIENKKNMVALIKKGNINDPLTVELSKYLPGAVGNKLLSTDTQLYKTGLFDEFGVLKTMFPGQIRVKEIELLEDKLATLDKSHEAKAQILETGALKLERDIILAKYARQVEKQNPNASLLEFEELVSEKAKPDLDKLFDKISKQYDKIYLDYAPNKSSYVDQYGEIYKDVAKADLKALFDQAKEQGIEQRPK